MNSNELIEHLHAVNAAKLRQERHRLPKGKAWWLAIPAAAAVALLVLLPQHGAAKTKPVTGLHVYCNNNCQQQDAIDLIGQNINEIRSTVIE
ncbi:MAG: hypothetical protein IJR26_06260 [Bacteroidales bacterium]|jgi:hypothetical protein|nr:hypothetical protein [Bacteroidales bacterium]